MGRKFFEKEIDGEIYTFYMLRPRISLSLLIRMIKMIGPGIGKAFPQEVKVKDVLDSDINIGGLFSELSNKLNDSELQSVIDILFEQIDHKGEGNLMKGMAYDNLFTGRLKHLLTVTIEALKVQYSDFLAGKDPLDFIKQETKKLGL